MKKALSIALFLFFWTVTNAQVRPEAYIGKLPSVPQNVCSEDNTEAKDEFIAKLNEVSESLQVELDRRSENNDADSDANEQKMLSNAVKKTGVSPELIQQLMALEQANKGATGDQLKAYEAKKKAIADQMIQQKMNISMGEIDNLKKTSAAGQKAWATGYATEMQAEVDADPQKYKDQNAKEMQKFNLQKKQKQLKDSLNAQQNKYMNKFKEVDNDETGQKLLEKINSVRAKISELYTEASKRETSPDQDQLAALKSEMVKAKKSYCALLTPKYLDALASYKSFSLSSLSALDRLEKITNQVYESQNGVKFNTEPGGFGLGQVSSYIQKLRDAYKYNLYGSEDWMIGYNK
jgi:hypothetical protein